MRKKRDQVLPRDFKKRLDKVLNYSIEIKKLQKELTEKKGIKK